VLFWEKCEKGEKSVLARKGKKRNANPIGYKQQLELDELAGGVKKRNRTRENLYPLAKKKGMGGSHRGMIGKSLGMAQRKECLENEKKNFQGEKPNSR